MTHRRSFRLASLLIFLLGLLLRRFGFGFGLGLGLRFGSVLAFR